MPRPAEVTTKRWRSQLGRRRLSFSETERCTTRSRGLKRMGTRSSAPDGWMSTKATKKGLTTGQDLGCDLKLKDHRLDLFATTPTLECVRFLCSLCVSPRKRRQPCRIFRADVQRTDLQYAAKEVAKKIAAPRQADWP